jgi:hypothetical protein
MTGSGVSQIATAKLSSKGQVAASEEIRKRVGLEPGSQYFVMGDRDVVVLKVIHAPEMSQFDRLIESARRAAVRRGMTHSDVGASVREVRKAK